MSKREDSSLILQNLKKRELPALGRPVVSLEQAEAQLTGAADISFASSPAISADSSPATEPAAPRTRLRPHRRVARSALLVRLDPELHRRLDDVARYNGLTMNDIVVEAIELHLGDFAQPPA